MINAEQEHFTERQLQMKDSAGNVLDINTGLNTPPDSKTTPTNTCTHRTDENRRTS